VALGLLQPGPQRCSSTCLAAHLCCCLDASCALNTVTACDIWLLTLSMHLQPKPGKARMGRPRPQQCSGERSSSSICLWIQLRRCTC
jgi:hypothetical protein